MNQYTLIHNQKENCYEFHIEAYTAYIEYEKYQDVLHLTRTIVPKELGGRGIAKSLCIAVMKEIETQGLKCNRSVHILSLLLKKIQSINNF